ncbi:MAG: hypothetical protein ACK55I_48260, partial [bacterium]
MTTEGIGVEVGRAVDDGKPLPVARRLLADVHRRVEEAVVPQVPGDGRQRRVEDRVVHVDQDREGPDIIER